MDDTRTSGSVGCPPAAAAAAEPNHWRRLYHAVRVALECAMENVGVDRKITIWYWPRSFCFVASQCMHITCHITFDDHPSFHYAMWQIVDDRGNLSVVRRWRTLCGKYRVTHEKGLLDGYKRRVWPTTSTMTATKKVSGPSEIIQRIYISFSFTAGWTMVREYFGCLTKSVEEFYPFPLLPRRYRTFITIL